MIYADYHTHTLMSHGRCTPSEVIKIAASQGLREIAISEHAPSMKYGLSVQDFHKLKDELIKLDEENEGKLKVLMGIESNFCGNGKLDIPKGIDFDVIVAGYHRSIPLKNGFAWSARIQSFSPFSSPEKNTDEILRTLDNYPEVNILAHPSEYIRLNIRRIAKASAERGFFMEINNIHVAMTVDEIKEAADCGARFIISSDGHRPSGMCRFDNALSKAREAGILSLVKNWEE